MNQIWKKRLVSFLLAALIIFCIKNLGLEKESTIVFIAGIVCIILSQILIHSPIGHFIQPTQLFQRRHFDFFHLVAAIILWVTIIIGILIFVIPRAHNFSSALGYGLLFELVIDGVLALNNYIMIENWSFQATRASIPFSILLIGLLSVFIYWLNITIVSFH